MHTDLVNLVIHQENFVYLILENPKDNPQATVTATLKVANGLIIQQTFGDDWVYGEHCTIECKIKLNLAPGDKNDTNFLIFSPKQEGPFTVKTDAQWEVSGNSIPKTISIEKQFHVTDKIFNETAVTIRADRTKLAINEHSIVNLSILNSITNNRKMIAEAILVIPSGLSIIGTDFADSCTGTCRANRTIDPGRSATIAVRVTPNQDGEFTVEEKSVWHFDDSQIPYTSNKTVILTVNPRDAAAPEREPTYTPIPTPTLTPTPTPTLLPPPPPAASGNSNGQGNLVVSIVGVAIIIVALLGAGLALAYLSNRKRKQNSGSASNQPPNQPPNSGQNPP